MQKPVLELKEEKLDIIIVSDLHLNFDAIQGLAKNVKANGYHFDYCLVGGDISNCDYESNSHNQQEMISLTKDCLTKLQDILQCKVLWIPGNHDSVSFFNAETNITDSIINIHKKEYVLQAGLRIIGLGGSLPAYKDQESKEEVWCGYPYKCEEEYKKDLQVVFHKDQIKSSKIFFTHVGPSLSSTTIDRRKQFPIYAGSHSLNTLTKDEDMLLLIHGHVHYGGKYDILNSKPIVNPGALLLGEYAILNLKRSNKIWKISKISFQKIF